MHNFQNELQGLGIDPFRAGELVPIGQEMHDTRLWGRCGGFRCGGFRCGFGCGFRCGFGCGFRCGFGCGGCGFGCGGCFGFGFGCFGIGFGFI